MSDHVFHRDFNMYYPLVERADGVYLYDENNKKYLDASSGAIAVNVGHGNKKIIEAINAQANKVAFAHTMRFETKLLHDFSDLIASLAPEHLDTVFYTSGGAEANESALKLARQYHLGKGNTEKTKIIGRWNSYHGNTLWALTVGGDSKRRQIYKEDLHSASIHVYPPYWTRDPYKANLNLEDYGEYCVNQLEQAIIKEGPETISALIVEPISGSQIAALVPPENYLVGIRRLCEKYDIIMVADEVMTGFGRTGKPFAVEHWGVNPDIITFAKGVTSAYLPLGGMIVHDKIIQVIKEKWDGKFAHGYTFSGHPLALAAGKANVEFLLENNLMEHANQIGDYLMYQLADLKEKYSLIGEIRGKGLLIGFEIIADKAANKAFPSKLQVASQFNKIATKNGAVLYPGQGEINGQEFDHILLGPPLIISKGEVDELINILDISLKELSAQYLSYIK